MKKLIDYQAAIDALFDWEMTYDWDDRFREVDPKPEYIVSPSDVIKKLPTAESKRGKWQYNGKHGTFKIYTCDQCGWNSEAEFNFCPNCGSDHREVTE